jgi:hypothetical protein
MYLQGQITSGRIIGELNQTLKILADSHAEEYNQDLNGMSSEELINRFKGAVRTDVEQRKAANAERKYGGTSDYKIVLIPDADSASKYQEYVSWCVCTSPNMYESYTHDGMGVFYFLLKNGFENIPKEKGPNCPLDEYGLSMIAVSINEDGSINTVTCRWNHSEGGNDNIMTDEQLSQLLGKDVYQVLKPVGIEVLVDNDRFRIFSKNGKVKVFDKKCNEYSDFDEYGFATIGVGYQQLKGKINLKGEIVIPEKYFDCGDVEADGCCSVNLYGIGLISINGQTIFNQKDEKGLSILTKATPSGTRYYKDSEMNPGLINVKLGKHIKPGTYSKIDHLDDDNRFRVTDNEGNIGLLNDDLSIAIAPGSKYYWIDVCEKLGNEPLRTVWNNNELYGLIDKNLKEVLPTKFDSILEPNYNRDRFRVFMKTVEGRRKGELSIEDGYYVITWSDGNKEVIRKVNE